MAVAVSLLLLLTIAAILATFPTVWLRKVFTWLDDPQEAQEASRPDRREDA